MTGKTAENYFLREVLRFFSASCSTTLTIDIAIAIMKAEIADEYIVVMLNDIRAYDFALVNKLTQRDLNNIASTGFQFATRGVKNQREEVRSFLLNHPSTMAADIDTIIIKLRLYGQLLSDKDDDEEVSGDQQAEDMRWARVRPEKRKTILLKNAFR